MGKESKQTFSQRRYSYGNQVHKKGGLISPITREVQMETMRYLLLVRMIRREKRKRMKKKRKMLAGVWGKGKLHCWRDCNLVQPLWKTGRRFHKDYKCNYHINRCSTSGNTCEGNKISMRDLHPQVRWSIIYTS